MSWCQQCTKVPSHDQVDLDVNSEYFPTSAPRRTQTNSLANSCPFVPILVDIYQQTFHPCNGNLGANISQKEDFLLLCWGSEPQIDESILQRLLDKGSELIVAQKQFTNFPVHIQRRPESNPVVSGLEESISNRANLENERNGLTSQTFTQVGLLSLPTIKPIKNALFLAIIKVFISLSSNW